VWDVAGRGLYVDKRHHYEWWPSDNRAEQPNLLWVECMKEHRHAKFTVTDKEGIDELLGLIHDEFFDVDQIEYSPSTEVLDIPFYRCFHGVGGRVIKAGIFSRLYELPVLRCHLRVCHAREYELIDTEKIGWYDFGTIEYDAGLGKISVETNVPLKLTIMVSSFHLEYEEMDFCGTARVRLGTLLPFESGPSHFNIQER
jgi:hypothetical protein